MLNCPALFFHEIILLLHVCSCPDEAQMEFAYFQHEIRQSHTLDVKPPKRFTKLRFEKRAEFPFPAILRFQVMGCCWLICRMLEPAEIAAFSEITHQDK